MHLHLHPAFCDRKLCVVETLSHCNDSRAFFSRVASSLCNYRVASVKILYTPKLRLLKVVLSAVVNTADCIGAIRDSGQCVSDCCFTS